MTMRGILNKLFFTRKKALTIRVKLEERFSAPDLQIRYTLVDTLEERGIGEVYDEGMGEDSIEVTLEITPSKKKEAEIKSILQSLGQVYFSMGAPKYPVYMNASASGQFQFLKSRNGRPIDVSGKGINGGLGIGPVAGSYGQSLDDQGNVTAEMYGLGYGVGVKGRRRFKEGFRWCDSNYDMDIRNVHSPLVNNFASTV